MTKYVVIFLGLTLSLSAFGEDTCVTVFSDEHHGTEKRCLHEDSTGSTECTTFKSPSNALTQHCWSHPKKGDEAVWVCLSSKQGVFCTPKMKVVLKPVERFYIE